MLYILVCVMNMWKCDALIIITNNLIIQVRTYLKHYLIIKIYYRKLFTESYLNMINKKINKIAIIMII